MARKTTKRKSFYHNTGNFMLIVTLGGLVVTILLLYMVNGKGYRTNTSVSASEPTPTVAETLTPGY